MIKATHTQRLLMSAVVGTAMHFGAAQANTLDTNAVKLPQNVAAQEFKVDILSIPTNDERGAENNIVQEFYVGPGASITSFRWDVNVTSYEGSYLSEIQLTFSDSLGNGVTFTLDDSAALDGTRDYAGFQDLRLLPVSQAFQLGADGILRLEFHDDYKDLAFDEPEGIWNSGTLAFGVTPVPEPQTYALMLGGLLLILRAARRRMS